MQKLAEKMVALGRFLFRTSERSEPFFKLLQGVKRKSVEWNEECKKSFEELKAQL